MYHSHVLNSPRFFIKKTIDMSSLAIKVERNHNNNNVGKLRCDIMIQSNVTNDDDIHFTSCYKNEQLITKCGCIRVKEKIM